MDIGDYPDWSALVRDLAYTARTVAIVGESDVGKTTFGALLANCALEAGRRVAVVDADVGQSEVGPPACVSYGMPEAPAAALGAVKATYSAFVGAVTPAGALVEHVAATAQVFHAACVSGADLVVLDTTGLVRGALGRRLKQAKLRAVRPEHIVAIQRRGECEAAIASFAADPNTAVHRLPVPPVIGRKPGDLRTQRRAARFALHFAGAEVKSFHLGPVALANTWISAGHAVEPHLQRFIEQSLRRRVYHAEVSSSHLGVVLEALPEDDRGMGAVLEQMRPREVTLTPVGKLHHLLVALEDGAGRTLGLGLLESLRFRKRELGLLTPVRSVGAVRVVRFGLLRLQADGTELGTIRAADV